MKKNIHRFFQNLFFTIIISCFLISCKKSFLNEKPSSDLVVPKTLDDYQRLLDNPYIFGKTGSLQQIASDDYFLINDESLSSLRTSTERNLYLWKEDVYEGENTQLSWNSLFKTIFYANNIIENVNKLSSQHASLPLAKNILAAAYFHRAYSYFDLARNFCATYNEDSLNSLGLPLRESPGIDYLKERSTLKETYDFILNDLHSARMLFQGYIFPVNHKNRPSLEASYALFSRIYLAMGDYEKATLYADSCLSKYSKIIDYNSICQECLTPFTFYNEEVIFHSSQVAEYSSLTENGVSNLKAIDTNLIKEIEENDLRLKINFIKNSNGFFNKKRGFIGSGLYEFTGLTSAEMYLNRAEGRVRTGDFNGAREDLEHLLSFRYRKNSSYSLAHLNKEELLNRILLERRKELVYRGIRWSDLKRLNREGKNIILERVVNGNSVRLMPNDTRYIFPIPDEEIMNSNIKQN